MSFICINSGKLCTGCGGCREEKEYRCPICYEEAEYLYTNADGEIVGCEECITKQRAEAVLE